MSTTTSSLTRTMANPASEAVEAIAAKLRQMASQYPNWYRANAIHSCVGDHCQTITRVWCPDPTTRRAVPCVLKQCHKLFCHDQWAVLKSQRAPGNQGPVDPNDMDIDYPDIDYPRAYPWISAEVTIHQSGPSRVDYNHQCRAPGDGPTVNDYALEFALYPRAAEAVPSWVHSALKSSSLVTNLEGIERLGTPGVWFWALTWPQSEESERNMGAEAHGKPMSSNKDSPFPSRKSHSFPRVTHLSLQLETALINDRPTMVSLIAVLSPSVGLLRWSTAYPNPDGMLKLISDIGKTLGYHDLSQMEVIMGDKSMTHLAYLVGSIGADALGCPYVIFEAKPNNHSTWDHPFRPPHGLPENHADGAKNTAIILGLAQPPNRVTFQTFMAYLDILVQWPVDHRVALSGLGERAGWDVETQGEIVRVHDGTTNFAVKFDEDDHLSAVGVPSGIPGLWEVYVVEDGDQGTQLEGEHHWEEAADWEEEANGVYPWEHPLDNKNQGEKHDRSEDKVKSVNKGKQKSDLRPKGDAGQEAEEK